MRNLRRAFTLIELLVVVTLIIMLLAILLPSINRSAIMAKRTREAANTRQVVLSCLNFASDHVTLLPSAQTETINYQMSWALQADWQVLIDSYGVPFQSDPQIFGCTSWSSTNPVAGTFYNVSGGNWQLPWIYWGNRPNNSSATPYTFIHSLTDSARATSRTLLTCYSRETDNVWSSAAPHIEAYNDEGTMFPAGLSWVKPDWFCVGFIDGATQWVPFSNLKGFSGSAIASKFYYAPNK